MLKDSMLDSLRDKFETFPYLKRVTEVPREKKTDDEPKEAKPQKREECQSDDLTSTEKTLESDGWYRIDKKGKRLASARLREALLSGGSEKTKPNDGPPKDPPTNTAQGLRRLRPSQLNKSLF